MARKRGSKNGNGRRPTRNGRWTELDARLKQVAETVEQTSRAVNRLTGSWGQFIEGMVEPSWLKYLEQHGSRVLQRMRNVGASLNGENAEYDLLAVSRSEVYVLEAKTTVSSKDVDEFESRHFGRFFEFFPQFKDRQLRGAIAGAKWGEGADRYALRKGFYVLRPSGEIMKISPPAHPARQPSKVPS